MKNNNAAPEIITLFALAFHLIHNQNNPQDVDPHLLPTDVVATPILNDANNLPGTSSTDNTNTNTPIIEHNFLDLVAPYAPIQNRQPIHIDHNLIIFLPFDINDNQVNVIEYNSSNDEDEVSSMGSELSIGEFSFESLFED